MEDDSLDPTYYFDSGVDFTGDDSSGLSAADLTPVSVANTASVYAAPASASPYTAGTSILSGLSSIGSSIGNLINGPASPTYVVTPGVSSPSTASNLGSTVSSALSGAVSQLTGFLPVIIIGVLLFFVLKLFKK